MSRNALTSAACNCNVSDIRANIALAGQADKEGWTALMWAVGCSDMNCTLELIAKETRLTGKNGCTALMRAAALNNVEKARLLLCEVQMQTNDRMSKICCTNIDASAGATALMLAARKGHFEIVELLLPYEQGLKDSEGHTAQWYANNSSGGGDYTRVRELLKNEGTERLPPPNPEVPNQEHITESSAKPEYQLTSSENTYEETEESTSQSNQEGSSPKQQIDKATEESDRRDELQKASDQKQALIDELTIEKTTLQEQLASSKKTLEEAEKLLSQLNQENSSLKQQLQKANEEAKKNHELDETLNKRAREAEKSLAETRWEITSLKAQLSKTTEDLKRALADQKARNLALEKENARLRTESHDMKDLQRRLEEVEEEKRILLQNIAAIGGKIVPTPVQESESRISAAIQGDSERRPAVKDVLKEAEREDDTTPDTRAFPSLPESMKQHYSLKTSFKGRPNTFKAVDSMNKPCMIEVVPHPEGPSLLNSPTELKDLRHQNVLEYSCVTDDGKGRVFIVTAWHPSTLQDAMARRLGNGEIKQYLRQLALGLEYLHGKGIVLRSICPKSVLLSDDGECILGGLDCASFISDAPCKPVGEPLRRPPEMQQGRSSYGPSADIWALGLLAYELCTGKLPFTTEEQVARMDAPPPEERDQDLVTLVLRMLEKNPERRPTAQEVVRTLRRR
ncbi:Kinase, NEK [Giardia muris]|uniref:Kinase, NEK n=1 Tax=Giardia muris TaxID=5742 RepID=A0A4Z1T3P3_GIAMU|nr:Kinase, NEK [Giardia muris]|eukprot:TNJ28603.1 Kinase, NEK [Giardia muris]